MDALVRELMDEQREWAVVTRGRVHQADELPGFVAAVDGLPQGLLTYSLEGDECEVVTLDAVTMGRGIGSALLDAVRALAAARECRRVWLITTNDNLAALRFYQRYGFRLVALHRDTIAESRKLKPQIPELGCDGIPIRDEIELELLLAGGAHPRISDAPPLA
jgi:ribosomal protein S18 acetylase RimI-like enzyme